MNNELTRSVGTWDTIIKNGQEYVRFRCTYGGERKEFTGKTKKEVQKKVNKFETNPTNRTQIDTLKTSFHRYAYECCVYWATIKREKDCLPNSHQSDTLKRLEKSDLGKEQLGSINAKSITNYIMEMNDGSYAKKTINGDLALIKRCLNRALDSGVIKKNPASEVAPLREEEVVKKTRKGEYLELDDIDKLLKEAKRVNTRDCCINGPVGTRVYGVNADVICFLLFTGLRINECLALRWQDIIYENGKMTFLDINGSLKDEKDPTSGHMIVVRGTTKTKTSNRPIAINKNCEKIIKAQKKRWPKAKPSDYIFQSQSGTPILYRNVNRVLSQMLVRANCSNLNATCHSLRHTYGSYLIANGASVYNVSKMLGHSSIKVTQEVYLHQLSSSNIDTSSLIDNIDF